MTQRWDEKEPVRDLQSAEAYFRAMGCSHFFMSREYPDRYDEYRRLGVSKATETAWTRAVCDETLDGILGWGSAEREKLWWQHSYAAELAAELRDLAVVRKLREATEHMIPLVPPSTRILVAETLVGRGGTGRDPDGPILLARKLGDLPLARALAGLVPRFCDAPTAPTGGPPIAERRAKVLSRLTDLRARLNLDSMTGP